MGLRLARSGRPRSRWSLGNVRFDSDQAHHAIVLMFEKMAVVDESAHRIWIAKIHTEADAGVRESVTIVVRNVDRIAQKRLIHRDAERFKQHEVQLMDVKGV